MSYSDYDSEEEYDQFKRNSAHADFLVEYMSYGNANAALDILNNIGSSFNPNEEISLSDDDYFGTNIVDAMLEEYHNKSTGRVISRMIELTVKNGYDPMSVISKQLIEKAIKFQDDNLISTIVKYLPKASENEHFDVLELMLRTLDSEDLQDSFIRLLKLGYRIPNIWYEIDDMGAIWTLKSKSVLAIVDSGAPYESVLENFIPTLIVTQYYTEEMKIKDKKKLLKIRKILTVNYPEYASDDVYYPDYEEYLSERKKKLIDDYKEINPIFATLPKELQYKIVINI